MHWRRLLVDSGPTQKLTRGNRAILVPEAGLEPAWGCPRWILISASGFSASQCAPLLGLLVQRHVHGHRRRDGLSSTNGLEALQLVQGAIKAAFDMCLANSSRMRLCNGFAAGALTLAARAQGGAQ